MWRTLGPHLERCLLGHQVPVQRGTAFSHPSMKQTARLPWLSWECLAWRQLPAPRSLGQKLRNSLSQGSQTQMPMGARHLMLMSDGGVGGGDICQSPGKKQIAHVKGVTEKI